MRSHTLYLSDLAAALEKIEEFTAGMTYDQFLHDDRTQSAVIRKFEIIGEAAKKIPLPVREKYPAVPWREMAGMQDKLIHTYYCGHQRCMYGAHRISVAKCSKRSLFGHRGQIHSNRVLWQTTRRSSI